MQWFSRLTGREPQIPVEGVKMSRHRMFVESDKAERELGYKPGPVEAALGARGALVSKRPDMSTAARRQAGSRTRRQHRDSSVRILVTFALENEFAPWRALRNFRRSTWGAGGGTIARKSVARKWV